MTTLISDLLTISPEAMEASIRRVHAQHPDLSAVIEQLSEPQGELLCHAFAAMFLNNVNDFHRAGSIMALRMALNGPNGNPADRLVRAIVVDAVYNGAPKLGLEHLTCAEQALIIW
jgi:hypothetical protein